jgi:hypothetical protein
VISCSRRTDGHNGWINIGREQREKEREREKRKDVLTTDRNRGLNECPLVVSQNHLADKLPRKKRNHAEAMQKSG